MRGYEIIFARIFQYLIFFQIVINASTPIFKLIPSALSNKYLGLSSSEATIPVPIDIKVVISISKSNSFGVAISMRFFDFDLYFNFPPGTILEIKEITLYSNLGNFKILEKDIFITSKNTFFLNNNKANKIIFTKMDNEIINIFLPKNYENILKMQINMKISKADISNYLCDF